MREAGFLFLCQDFITLRTTVPEEPPIQPRVFHSIRIERRNDHFIPFPSGLYCHLTELIRDKGRSEKPSRRFLPAVFLTG